MVGVSAINKANASLGAHFAKQLIVIIVFFDFFQKNGTFFLLKIDAEILQQKLT